jgi:hypothetical protein
MKNLHSQISSVFECLRLFRVHERKRQKCPLSPGEDRRELLAIGARPDARGEGRRPATSNRHSDEVLVAAPPAASESPGPPWIQIENLPAPVPGCHEKGLQVAGRGEGVVPSVQRGGEGSGGGQRPARRGREGRRSAADARRGGRDADRRVKGPRAPGAAARKGGEEAGGRRLAQQGGEKAGTRVERRAGEGRRPGWGEMRMPDGAMCEWRAGGGMASLFLETRGKSRLWKRRVISIISRWRAENARG